MTFEAPSTLRYQQSWWLRCGPFELSLYALLNEAPQMKPKRYIDRWHLWFSTPIIVVYIEFMKKINCKTR